MLFFFLFFYLLHTVDLEVTSTCCFAILCFSQKHRDQFGQGLTSPRAQFLESSPFASAPASHLQSVAQGFLLVALE